MSNFINVKPIKLLDYLTDVAKDISDAYNTEYRVILNTIKRSVDVLDPNTILANAELYKGYKIYKVVYGTNSCNIIFAHIPIDTVLDIIENYENQFAQDIVFKDIFGEQYTVDYIQNHVNEFEDAKYIEHEMLDDKITKITFYIK